MSFKHKSKRNDTELSRHLWQLKYQKRDFAISWKILGKAKCYNNLTKGCYLFNTEKSILCKPDMATLNKRNELVSNCRHKRKFLPVDHFVGEPLRGLFVRYEVGL